VVALVDVKGPPGPSGLRFPAAADAVTWLRTLCPDNERYFAHAAQHDLEAWLLPYWSTAAKKAGTPSVKAPSGNPEGINHDKPPSWHLADLYRRSAKKYSKPRDGADILRGQDLTIAAAQCPQFKLFLNTLLTLAGCPALP
jgi:hypothetical protein